MNLEAETMGDLLAKMEQTPISSYRLRLVGELWRLGSYLGV